jgi:ABC-type sugar transport system ATPase subunit
MPNMTPALSDPRASTPAAQAAGVAPADAPPLLQMQGIHKSFPGVHALKGVELTLHAGEVLALLGENGAGKSTLMKVLGGAYRPEAGSIRINGAETHIHSPVDAGRLGIAIIYQEFNLIPALTVRENIFLGRETHRAGFCSRRTEAARVREIFQRLAMHIDPEARCGKLTVAQQQLVEIAKALFVNARILVMDEPTAALSGQDAERLFAIIRELQTQGLGIIYISHRLEEIFRIADRISVMRDGQYVGSRPIAAVTRESLIEMMVGRKLEDEFPHRATTPGPPRLVVSNLSDGAKVEGASFSIGRGEVLGLTGLVGAGRTELARMIFGADRCASGSVSLDGRALNIRSPRAAIEAGIALLTEDRKSQGLVLGRSIQENFALPNLPSFSRAGFIRHGLERARFMHFAGAMRLKMPSRNAPAKNLSGGNQQKVVLAKWLQRNCEVIIFDEPTRGVDVGAKFEIYLLINELAAQGKSILLISSELPEVLGMSDRIIVMHEGRIKGEITDVPHATQEQIMTLAVT